MNPENVPTPLAGPILNPQIYHNSASEQSQITYARILGVLERWEQAIVRQNLADSHVPMLAAEPFEVIMADVATQGHRDAALWSKVLPFVLLIWALTGAFYPAIDLCAGEKERGTLETLLSSPAERGEIVWGKLLTIMLFSMATSVLNLLSLGITGAFIMRQMNFMNSGEFSQFHAPPISALAWLFVALIPVSALFSALCLALAAFARSSKEGQYYLMPLFLITMPLMILPMAPGVELTLGNSLIPITGIVLLLRTLLEGHWVQALIYVAPVAAVTLTCCYFAIRWAVDQFNSESVLFRESERLDLKLWMKHLVRDRGATPTLAQAIACFVVILLIQFFMNMALAQPDTTSFSELAKRIFVNQVVMIVLPALFMTLLLTRNWAATLLIKEFPRPKILLATLLLALAVHPLAHSAQFVVQALYPIDERILPQLKLVETLLNNAPYAWLPFVLIALLPALCEEVAFRGFILSGLRHLGHKWGAILLSAILFGVAHGILQQSIIATFLGVILGFLAVQTGSLVACILFHLAHNGTMLLVSKLHISQDHLDQYPLLGLALQMTEGEPTGFTYAWPTIVASALLAALVLRWLHRLPYQKTAEEKLQEALGRQSLDVSSGKWRVASGK